MRGRRLGGSALALLLAAGGFHAVLAGTSRRLVASKTVYKVAIAGNSRLVRESRHTYDEYLNSAVGPLFSPPISFVSAGLPILDDVFTEAARQGFDFIQGNPTSMACLEEELGLQVLATRIGTMGDDSYGSVIFTRADSKAINHIQDLKDKIVVATTISGASGCLFGWKEMVDKGMSLMAEPKQVVFIGNAPGFEGYKSILEAVLQGVGDVAFVAVNSLETAAGQGLKLVAKNGSQVPADPELFKIIDPRQVTVGSYTYPFETSTDLYPTHSFGVLPNVDFDVRAEVTKAVLALNNTSPAVLLGSYSRWLPPSSFRSTRNMMEQLGLMSYDEAKASQKCWRQNDLWSAITCPKGTFKLSPAKVASSCTDAGLPCPSQFQCICRPCKAARPIEVQPVGPYSQSLDSCTKMSTCLTQQQSAEVLIIMQDNRLRTLLNVTWILHDRDGLQGAGVHWGDGMYNISFSTARTGMHLLEVFVDGQHIEDSPFFVEIVPRKCERGSFRTANDDGHCLCMQDTLEVKGLCVKQSVFLPSLLVPIIVLLFAVSMFAVWRRGRAMEDDKFWVIDPRDVKFADQPEVLGRGSFGLVLKAEYRGTTIAVKRATPQSSGLFTPTPFVSRQQSASKGLSNADSSGHVAGQAKTDADMVPDTMFDIEEGTERDDEEGASSQVTRGSFTHDKQGKGLKHLALPPAPGPSLNTTDSMEADEFIRNFRPTTPETAGGTAQSNSGGFVRGFVRSTTRPSVASETSSCNSGGHPSGTSARERTSRTSAAAIETLFVEEMRFLARLRHPCITTVLGMVVMKECRMLCMELMENGSLFDLIRNETLVLESDMLLSMINDVVMGMRFLHAANPPILHGDLKAQNILIDSSFKAKISDFGLSQKLKVWVSGSSFWMAPEVLRGEKATCGSDVYSFGVIVYQAISRKDPYDGENMMRVIEELANPRDPQHPKRPVIPQGCPAKIAEMTELCWQSSPEDRPSFQQIEELMANMDIKDLRLTMLEQIRQHKRVSAQSKLLLDVFPKHIADALVAGKKVEPEYKECATIFFSDIVGFTHISSSLPPDKVSSMLDRLYTQFDALSLKYEVFKVETIGDAYMAVTNLVRDQSADHAARIAQFALECVQVARKTVIDEEDPSMGCVTIRAGFHSGPIVARVVGTRNPRYCLFGDTVNIASRMESVSVPNMINCSKSSARYLRAQLPGVQIESRGLIDIKGKGKMETFWVRRSDADGSGTNIARRPSDHLGAAIRDLGTGDIKLGICNGTRPSDEPGNQSLDRNWASPQAHASLLSPVVRNGVEKSTTRAIWETSLPAEEESPEGSLSNDGTAASRGSTSSAWGDPAHPVPGLSAARCLAKAVLPTQGLEPDGSTVTEGAPA